MLTWYIADDIIWKCLISGARYVQMGVSQMTPDSIADVPHVTGIKQVTKAVQRDEVKQVFIASDADERVIRQLKTLCREKSIEADTRLTMEELGKACLIEVGSAAVAILR